MSQNSIIFHSFSKNLFGENKGLTPCYFLYLRVYKSSFLCSFKYTFFISCFFFSCEGKSDDNEYLYMYITSL